VPLFFVAAHLLAMLFFLILPLISAQIAREIQFRCAISDEPAPTGCAFHWISPDGSSLYVGSAATGAPYEVSSFVGHSFQILQEGGGASGEIVSEFVVPPLGEGEDAADLLQVVVTRSVGACPVDGAQSEILTFPGFEICGPSSAVYVNDGLDRVVLGRDQREDDTRAANEARRVHLNLNQPHKVPRFTTEGFALRRMPDNLHAMLLQHVRRQFERQIVEPWPKGDSYVNFWETPTTMMYLQPGQQKLINEALKPILEEWIRNYTQYYDGDKELKPTSCYGVRMYKKGNFLRHHVDRVQTHAVSAILHIDSHALAQPWPLEIWDHDRVLHRFNLTAGDMVLYESASCIHGRPSRLVAASDDAWYANSFVHFAPKNDWNFEFM